MKILWEDVVKYGTREEVEFLLEDIKLSLQGEFLKTLSQFRDKMATDPSLATTYAEELKTIDLAKAGGESDLSKVPLVKQGSNLGSWIIKNKQQAVEIQKKLKSALFGNIYKGAFGSSR